MSAPDPGLSRPSRAGWLRRFLAARLSPEGAAGLHLTVGLLVLLVAMTAFGVVAEEVRAGAAITVVDVELANWLHARALQPAAAPLTAFMHAVSDMHGALGGSVLSALLIGYLSLRRQQWWRRAALVVLPGGMLLNVLIKYSFQRARPTFDAPLLTLTTYSFPSGHTAFAAMFYGLLACFLLVRPGPGQGLLARCAIVSAAGAMVALVAASRLYLGVHYLSDVLGAVAEGCVWLAICITVFSTLRRRREGRPL